MNDKEKEKAIMEYFESINGISKITNAFLAMQEYKKIAEKLYEK